MSILRKKNAKEIIKQKKYTTVARNNIIEEQNSNISRIIEFFKGEIKMKIYFLLRKIQIKFNKMR